MNAAAATGMAVTALGMVLTPGPNMIYLVSRSLSQGRAAGLISLAGTGVGFVVYLTMANLGLAVVFVAVPWLFTALKAAGVAYLAWLAWQTLRPGGRGVFESRPIRHDSRGRLFRMGLVTNLLNPKTALLYLALIPQFIDPAEGDPTAQGFALGAIQIAVSLTVNAAFVLTAAAFSGALAARPAWTIWQRRASGTLLAGAAVVLALDLATPARP
ncbi:LysE family translocator [Herbiconiux liukaitaii]|uniref:LysE family translocator n=1 Tax=Herbiconiux liukaitaii TaxID=3342799 RepID=UPI0035BA651E